MLKRTISYIDFNDKERKEDFYFNLTKAEIAEMELSTEGGLSELIKKVVAAENTPAIVEIFKDLILRSYGEKSPDGKRFIKSKELSEQFTQTNAYSELFMELATDQDAASKFINAIIPKMPAQKAIPPKK